MDTTGKIKLPSGLELTPEELTEKLTGVFADMPCDLSEPQMTPEERAAFEREVAEEEAFNAELARARERRAAEVAKPAPSRCGRS